ncbi:hypothetical protein Tco_0622661 [Tanacetum coccineum]
MFSLLVFDTLLTNEATSDQVKMDDPNITMEEYIRREEEKARRRGQVYNWEIATYGKIWYDEDVHDLRSVEIEFSAIVFNDALTSEVALSCEPTVSPLNDNQIDFRISFDESDDEDYTIIYDKNSFSYKIISVNNLKTDSKNGNDKVNMPSFSSSEPTVTLNHDKKVDFETLLSECDEPPWKEIDNVDEVLIIWNLMCVVEAFSTYILAHEIIMENHTEQILGEFLILII